MAKFMVQAPHNGEQCLSALDEMVAMGPGEVDRWDLGCAVGDHSNHVAYRVIDAADVNAARNMVPASGRSRAQITEVGNLTADQVRSFHK